MTELKNLTGEERWKLMSEVLWSLREEAGKLLFIPGSKVKIDWEKDLKGHASFNVTIDLGKGYEDA